ncbi:MAG: hypothetical protein H7330_01495 [Hymenobacteraceae bacterium]|nr:hypothetical protein [Hymenobacteraceae bacterium]
MALALPSSDSRIAPAKLFSILLNSAALYVLAYTVMHVALQLTEIILAYRYVIPTIWYPSKLNFRIQDLDWRRSTVVIVFALGQTLCLFLAGFFMLRLRDASEKGGMLKLFYAWLVLHGCNQFFGAMVADNFVRDGFWLSPRFLFTTTNIPAVTAGFLFANLCLLIGYKLSLPFLKTCDSITLMRLENRPALIWTTIFGPWAVGTLAINLCKLNAITILEESHLFSILLLLIPMAVGVRFEMHETTSEAPRRPRLARGLMLGTILVLIAFRLVLHKGVYFRPHGYMNYPGLEVVNKLR